MFTCNVQKKIFWILWSVHVHLMNSLVARTVVDFTKCCDASQLDLRRIILRNSQRFMNDFIRDESKLRGVS
jgi:hypothetical protein